MKKKIIGIDGTAEEKWEIDGVDFPSDVPGGGGTSGHIEIPFSYDQAVSPVTVGPVPVGAKAFKTCIKVTAPFDGALLMTIGTDISQGALAVAGESNLAVVNNYQIFNDTAVDGAVKLFPSYTDQPTRGAAVITVYYA